MTFTEEQAYWFKSLLLVDEGFGLTCDMMDDLFVGLVAMSVMCNLGSGKTPERMDLGDGPSKSEKELEERFESLEGAFVGLVREAYTIEDFRKEYGGEWKQVVNDVVKLEKMDGHRLHKIRERVSAKMEREQRAGHPERFGGK